MNNCKKLLPLMITLIVIISVTATDFYPFSQDATIINGYFSQISNDQRSFIIYAATNPQNMPLHIQQWSYDADNDLVLYNNQGEIVAEMGSNGLFHEDDNWNRNSVSEKASLRTFRDAALNTDQSSPPDQPPAQTTTITSINALPANSPIRSMLASTFTVMNGGHYFIDAKGNAVATEGTPSFSYDSATDRLTVTVQGTTYVTNSRGQIISMSQGSTPIPSDFPAYSTAQNSYNNARSAFTLGSSRRYGVFSGQHEGQTAYYAIVVKDGENVFYRYDPQRDKFVAVSEEERSVLTNRLANLNDVVDDAKVVSIELDKQHHARALELQNRYRSGLRQNVLNQMYQRIDGYFGDYSLGMPDAICRIVSFNDLRVPDRFEATSKFDKSQDEMFEDYKNNIFRNIRVAKFPYTEAYEIIPEEQYRYSYSLRMSFDRAGVEWETFLCNSENGDLALVDYGASERQFGYYYQHYAGAVEGQAEGSINLANVRCTDTTKCKFDRVCVWFKDKGLRFTGAGSTVCENLNPVNFDAAGTNQVNCRSI